MKVPKHAYIATVTPKPDYPGTPAFEHPMVRGHEFHSGSRLCCIRPVLLAEMLVQYEC